MTGNEVIHLIQTFAPITGLPDLPKRIDSILEQTSDVNEKPSFDFQTWEIKTFFRYVNITTGCISCLSNCLSNGKL